MRKTEYEKLQEKGFIPKFEEGDTVQTKADIRFYQRYKIAKVGNIQYLVKTIDGYPAGTILFRYENEWEKI